MSRALIDAGAMIACPHGGRAVVAVGAPRVTFGGPAAVTIAAPLVVTGCTLPPAAGGPCTGGAWLGGTTRVAAGGVPLATGTAVATPTGAPLIVAGAQARVTAA